MELTKVTCPTNKIAIKCPYSMVPEGITIHNTANDASAMSEISYMLGNDLYVSFHLCVDDYRVVQGVEFNRNSFNAGDGANGYGNRKTISIEICYSKSGGDRFIQAEKNAVQLIVYLMKLYGWGIDRIEDKRIGMHQDRSGKYCPHRTLDMGRDRFINMIKTELANQTQSEEFSEEELKMIEEMKKQIAEMDKRISALEGKPVAPTAPVQASGQAVSVINPGDRVTLSNNATVYQGASKGVKIPPSKKGKVYTVQQVNNNIVLLKELVSWVLKSEVIK